MKHSIATLAALILIVAGAAAIRIAHIENRPMHTDEAVHGIKFGDLLENGKYVYDPHEYHGPTLNYLTVPVVRLGGGNTLAQTTETQLRLVPAICGILLIAGLWLIRDLMGRGAMLCAAVLCAISPAMIFYSRYYIQEMLLVCFTFFAIAAIWRCVASPNRAFRTAWLIVGGACMGLMHATKETCVIAIFSMVVAGGVGALAMLIGPGRWTKRGVKSIAFSGLIVLAAGAVVSVVLMSTFFSNMNGPLDSITTYGQYLTRSGGKGSAGMHSYHWDNYLHRILWWRTDGGAVWTEGFIVVLAVIGGIAGLLRCGCDNAHVKFVRFLTIYTIVMTVFYSALSYKTPWCLLGFLHGMILLAGVGAAALLRMRPALEFRVAVLVILIAGASHLGWLGWRGSFSNCVDPGNPYVYVHPTRDVTKMVSMIKSVAQSHPQKNDMPMQIICPKNHAWPFPWYLREFTQIDWIGNIPTVPYVLIYPSDQRNEFVPKTLNWPRFTVIDPETPQGSRPRDYWEQRPNVRIDMRINRKLLKAHQAAEAAKSD